jgi:uncharacterized protein with GYD domain
LLAAFDIDTGASFSRCPLQGPFHRWTAGVAWQALTPIKAEEIQMPKYLITGSYTAEGAKGLIKEGGTARREVAERAAASVGATVEAYYFAFGKDDFYLIIDAPGNAAVSAFSLAVSAAGGAHARTVVLITPEEMDAAHDLKPDYSPPGG